MTNPINPIETVQAMVDALEAATIHYPSGKKALTAGRALLAQMQSQPSDEREALRYQWLRDLIWDVAPAGSDDERAAWSVRFVSPYGMGSEDEDSLSAAIDAAMKEGNHAALGPVKAQQEPAVLPETMSRDEMLAYYSNYANLCAHEALRYQKRIRDLEAKLAAHQGAQPAVPSKLVKDAFFDMGYQAGLKAGWNLCVADDQEGFQRAMASSEHIKVLKAAAAPSASAQPQEGSNNG